MMRELGRVRYAVALSLSWVAYCLGAACGQDLVSDNLVAHWPLASDARDVSANAHVTTNHGVRFETANLAGRSVGAARFDGLSSYLHVPRSETLDTLGTRDFSILLRVDVLDRGAQGSSDLVSKYDGATRTGFRLGIDSRSGVTSSQSNLRQLHFGIDQGRTGAWHDHGRLGNAVLIFGMAVCNDQLFVGTCEAGAAQAGHVFRFDGEQWFDCGAPGQANAVSALAEYQGQLYVGLSKYRLRGSSLTESENPHLGGAVYRLAADGRWEFCGQLPQVEAISGLVVYGGALYAGSTYAPAGFFRYAGGTDWRPCATPGGKRVESLAVYRDRLYATGYDEGAVYRFDGEHWDRRDLLPGASQTYGFAVYRGELHVSEWPHAQVFRLQGGEQWQSVGRLGDEKEAMPLLVYNGKLYGGTLPLAEVYRHDDGDQWTSVGRLDFTPDVTYRRVWSMAVYRGQLFAGTLPSGHVHSIEIGKNVTLDHSLTPGWHHVAAVKQGGQLHLYVDGDRVASSTHFDPEKFDLSHPGPTTLGFGSSDYLGGRLRDVRLYTRAISAAEVHQLARQPVP